MKTCSSCGIEKSFESFNKNKRNKDGLESQCRDCRNAYKRRYRKTEHGQVKVREYREKSKEKEMERNRKRYKTEEYKEYQREYRKENKDRLRELKRNWDKENKMFYEIRNHIYFAEKKGLVVDWDEEKYKEMIETFGNKCCLSGVEEDLHVDHFIAIETGHAGTYKGNMIPLSGELNQSKSNKNPFEWIKDQPNEIQSRFNEVVKKLSSYNGLTEGEFKDFVYWCYENKRTIDEIKKQNTNSLDLWKNK